jgi:glycosyltransferase involved in cell wall biosynthesis
MKLLLVQRFDLSNVGCGERIWRQAEILARRGHEVVLVHFPHAARRAELPALRPEIPPSVRGLALDRHSGSLLANKRILAEEIARADLVHLWKAYPDTGLPVLWNLHGRTKPLHYDWDDLEGGTDGIAHRLTASTAIGRLLSVWEREMLLWADTVTAASGQIADLCRQAGFPEDRLFPGPVGAVDHPCDKTSITRWETTLAGKRALTFLGQMEAEDFPTAVLEGVAEALRKFPESLLVLVGDGTARGLLERKARDLGIQDRTLFTGYVPREEAQALLHLSSLFLFPLRDDLMSRCKSPLVVIEAMSRSLPVVGSRVGEVPVMVGEAGVLVEGLGSSAWGEAIASLLSDPGRMERVGRMAREKFLSEWTWERSVDCLEAAYRRALEVAL